MSKISTMESLKEELEKISCYQIGLEEFIEIANKLGAFFPYQRSEKLQELTKLAQESSNSLRQSTERLKERTELLQKELAEKRKL